MSGIGGHQSARIKSDEWYTPPNIIKSLGDFDLDPCISIDRPWDTAKHHFTRLDDGLSMEWFGRVWMNLPYGQQAKQWLKKFQEHRDGVALIFARTETNMFFKYCWTADALLFIYRRLTFYHIDGTIAMANSGAPSVLIAYGDRNVQALRVSGIKGKLLIKKCK